MRNYQVTPSTAQKIQQLLSQTDSTSVGHATTSGRRVVGHVSITVDEADSNGYWECEPVYYDVDESVWVSTATDEEIHVVFHPAGTDLSEDMQYLAVRYGIVVPEGESIPSVWVWAVCGGASSGGGAIAAGCCGGEPTDEYHPDTAPWTASFEIRRAFGSGTVTTSGIDGTLYGDFAGAKLAENLPDWTHVLVVPYGTDIRDGITRLTGNNGLTYADGDEVRFNGTSSPRFVVVFVEAVNRGESGPDLYAYYRVFLMRHSA